MAIKRYPLPSSWFTSVLTQPLRYFLSPDEYNANIDYDKTPKYFKKGTAIYGLNLARGIELSNLMSMDTMSQVQAWIDKTIFGGVVKVNGEIRYFAINTDLFKLNHYWTDSKDTFNREQEYQKFLDNCYECAAKFNKEYNILSALSKKKLSADLNVKFVKAVGSYNKALIDFKNEFAGKIRLDLKEVNIAEAPVIVKKKNKKIAIKPKKKISGIGIAPVIILVIIVVAGVVVINVVVSWLRESAKVENHKVAVEDRLKNLDILVKAANDLNAGKITVQQYEDIKKVATKNIEVDNKTIETATKPEPSMFGDIQKTLITAGIVVVGINLLKK